MTRSLRTPLATVALLAILGSSACTPDAPPPPNPPPSSAATSQTPTPTATSTSTPSPTVNATEQAVAEAEATYTEFLKAYTEWMLAGTPEELSPELRRLASDEALYEVGLDGDADRSAGVVYSGGPMVIVAMKSAAKSESKVAISTCIDQTKFRATANGEPAEVPPLFRQESTIVRTNTGWIVEKDRGLPAKTEAECTP